MKRTRTAARGCRSAAAWSLALAAAACPLAASAENWVITPQIGDQETFTDNVLLTPTHRRSDLITTLSPALSITGSSARLEGNFSYSPTAYLYALTPSQDVLGHNLYANGTATLVPDHFFLDARGYASLQPTAPGLAAGGILPGAAPGSVNPGAIGTTISSGLPTAQLSQVTSFEASPYLVQRFDGIGTGELRYTFSNTNFGSSQTSPLVPPGFAVQSGTTLTHEGTAAFLTGENFGPFASRVLLDVAESSGTGGFSNARQTIGVDDSAYRINPRIFALASLGYEHIRYSSLPPVRINDVVWGFGARFLPRPDSTITVLYGHRNGVTSPYLSLSYAVTARTTLAVSYTSGLTTTSQQIADNLAVSSVNAAGQTVDTRTLLPFAIVNPALGLQSGLYRFKQVTGTASFERPRDHIALSAYHFDNALIAQSAAGLGLGSQSTGGNASWRRDLNPLTTANLGIGYEQISFPAQTGFDEGLLTASVSITYLLNSSLTGWAGYAFIHRGSPEPQLHLLSNTVFVGLSKVF
ncbi:MAG TPA: hypothetical protein VJ770_30500 [Stellaceae bacterium]|nr:hypothetical protein [Stellaceae bacterium]